MKRRSMLLLLFSVMLPAAVGHAEETKSRPGDHLFESGRVWQLQLTLTAQQFAALAPTGGGGFGPPGFGPPREQPPGTHRNTFGVDFPWSTGDLTFDGQTCKDIGLRYKGNYTYMATARSLKKSLKLDINHTHDEQRLDGLTTLYLHCGVSDPTRTREALSYALFRDAGIPAPRTAFAELILTVPEKYDEELVGVYTVTEPVNKVFLKRHFGDGGGMLLKPEALHGGPAFLGEEWSAYADRYHPKKEPTEDQKRHLINFTRLISNGSDEEFARDISLYLDVDAFLKFIAANTWQSNLDSYLGFGHNYFLYLIPKTNQFVFIPWDLDLSLATWPALGTPEQMVQLSIHHPHAGQNKLLDRLFAIAEHKTRYLAILQDLTDNIYTADKFLAHLDEIDKALRAPAAREESAVAARKENTAPGGFGPGFGNGQFGQSMPPRRFIEQRSAAVKSQLAGSSKGFEPKPLSFGPPPGGGFGPPRRDPR
jgi:spore coat protein H